MTDYASAPAGDYACIVASFAHGNGVMDAITAQPNPVQDSELAVPRRRRVRRPAA